MPDQSYTSLAAQSGQSEWLSRVKLAIVRYAVGDAIKAAPTVAQGPADALGRAVVADPETWKLKFSPVLAVQLIGSVSLSPADVNDAALFAAVAAVWPKFLTQPTPTG